MAGSPATGLVAEGDDPGRATKLASPAEPSASGGRVLLVEDDEQLLSALERHLSEEGFVVETAREGHEALAMLLRRGSDVGTGRIGAVVLDLLLPGLNGREVCYRLRAAGCWVPVLMATAFGEVEDRVQGFQDGADDYLVKPFSLAELVVRLRAIMRRDAWREGRSLEVGDLRLDLATQRVWRDGQEVDLSRRELAVLSVLMSRPGIVLSRQAIVRAVWGQEEPKSANLLEQHIAKLRRKLDTPFEPSHIDTLPKVGYRVRAPR